MILQDYTENGFWVVYFDTLMYNPVFNSCVNNESL